MTNHFPEVPRFDLFGGMSHVSTVRTSFPLPVSNSSCAFPAPLKAHSFFSLNYYCSTHAPPHTHLLVCAYI